MNWFQADVTEEDVKNIPYIDSLNEPTELVEAIQAYAKPRDITLRRGTKPFKELFSCNDTEHNLILIVVVATAHPNKKKLTGMPC